MKRFLLFVGIAAATVQAYADVPIPQLYNNVCINALSPDGKWAASEIYGYVTIIDLANGESYDYEPNDMVYPILDYSIGLGRCISNNGIVTGGTGSSNAEYWKDGDWHILDRGEATGNCISNGITPDGTRICGSIGKTEADNGTDALRQVPVIWEWDGNGYGKPIILPHPIKDVSGRVPQYCTAIDISDDGKTVIGQVHDGFGLMNYPLVYREGADGTWTYEIVHEELLNPNEIVMPEYPGEGPEIPMIDMYMTEEQIDAFYIALNVWYEEHPDDPEMDYLETLEFAKDFMDPEAYAACWAEMEAYMEWSNRLDEWNGLYDQICEDSPRYIFNNLHLSPDGDAFAANVNYGSPFVFSLVSDDYEEYTEFGTKYVSYFGSESRLILNGGIYSGQSWIFEDGKLIQLPEWISSRVPAYGEWMEENNFSNGIATGTPDFSVIGYWIPLGDSDIYLAKGVIMNIAEGMSAGASLTVDESAAKERIYDMHGRTVENPDVHGVYILNGKKFMTGK